ncbi:MAG TPA: DUF1453 domain-containing protein [Thermoanaerobaculia bacterium]|nr:DUF1453 domain-containing protein [Thermoanaerobaculia bacterium]
MPLLALAAVLIFLLVFTVAMVPLSIAMRFRASSTRRRALGWMATLNFFAACISSALLLVTAAVSNAWIPNTFLYVLIGLACGAALGLAGLLSSRWETTPQGLHYTPNRWLILLITVVVTARILYGFWRAWHALQTTPAGESWLAHSGAAGSMGAGGAVLGYYVVYWAGLRRRVRRHRSSIR